MYVCMYVCMYVYIYIYIYIYEGLVKPVIDRSFPLEETAKAHAYLEEGHARGKVLIEVASITE